MPSLIHLFILGIALMATAGVWALVTSRELLPTTEVIVRLLREDPGGWSKGTYIAHHARSGIGIWVANETYGLGYWVGTSDQHDRMFKPPRADRIALLRAVNKLGDCGAYEAATKALSTAEPALVDAGRGGRS